MPNKKKLISYAALFLTAIAWGSSFAARKIAAEVAPPMFINFLGFVVAFLMILCAYLMGRAYSKHKKGRFLEQVETGNMRGMKWHIMFGIVLGILYALCTFFQQLAMGSIEAGKCSFITSLYIIMIPLLSFVFFRKHICKGIWICAAIAVIGMLCISYTGAFRFEMGDLMALGGAFVFALEVVLLGDYLEGADAMLLATVQMFVSAIFFFVASVALGENMHIAYTTDVILAFLYLGAVPIGLADIMHLLAQKNVAPSVAGIILSFEGVFGFLFGVILLAEGIGLMKGIGCILMMTAVIGAQRDDSKS